MEHWHRVKRQKRKSKYAKKKTCPSVMASTRYPVWSALNWAQVCTVNIWLVAQPVFWDNIECCFVTGCLYFLIISVCSGTTNWNYCICVGATELHKCDWTLYGEEKSAMNYVYEKKTPAGFLRLVNLLATDFFFFRILAHPVFKMWVIQEPNKVALWNKRHFEEKEMEIIRMFKILGTDIYWKNVKWGI